LNTEVTEPEIKSGISRFEFRWPDLELSAICDRVSDEGTGELSIYHNNGHLDRLLQYNTINLLSAQSCTQYAKRLKNNLPNLDCDSLLTYIQQGTMERVRQTEPPARIGLKPQNMKIEYQLKPIIQRGKSTTIYAPGGSAKSYIADYIAVLVQCNIYGLGGLWEPMAGNVLYLDWESCKEDHQRRVWAIKQGLVREGIAVSPDETFAYQFEKGPLVDDIYYIQRLVTENNIEFMVIDSHMAAQGYGPDQAQVASQFYNTLRSLNCTTLTIDHVDKASWRGLGETVGPYGSVVKFNRSRAQFELIKQQGTGEDFVELALKHTKNNEGRLLPPIGIRIDFTNNEND
jgi:hypothetical protein